jgi:membrane protein YdbS with pleckstrin-like domain
MLDIVPFLVLLAAPVIAFVPFPVGDGRRWSIGSVAVVAVLVWSLFVSATGGVLYASACWNTTPVSVDVDPGRVWDWSDPQFLRPYQDLLSGRSVTEVALSPTCAVG